MSSLSLGAQEVLRGQVLVDLEPVFALHLDVPYPLDDQAARQRALEEAALFYSAMIYGWSFQYDVGEKARGIEEHFELESLGAVNFGDPRLFVTDAEVREMRLCVWTDYRLTEIQKRRVEGWKSGLIRSAQATGYGPLMGPPEAKAWIDIRRQSLEDAARSAVRAILRGSERNRPKEVSGYISLDEFPHYWMESGNWAVSAKFRVEVREILPFAAY